ncbi:hypothetical protein XENOCAPTIV_001187 [Xenoophorus captivus]|uniref:Uncharacterized protein n=1 Tax=Xenoophorus captivus TaxID=1517983 RepID=A0ABV0QQJ8_9TELE
MNVKAAEEKLYMTPLCNSLFFCSSVSYSRDESCRAKELLASVAQLQPLIFGLAEELLFISVEENFGRLQEVLDSLKEQTILFIHALKDELVKSALLDIHNQSTANNGSSHVHSNGLLCEISPGDQEGALSLGLQEEREYSEEEWASWSGCDLQLLHQWFYCDRWYKCVCVCVGHDVGECREESGLHHSHGGPVAGARAPPTGTILTGAAGIYGGHKVSKHRKRLCVSQLSALVCGFMLKLFGGLEDPDFLQQLHSVGILAQFEGLLSTYGEELGMLEDMEVGVADLSSVAFTVTEAESERPDDLLPTLRGTWFGDSSLQERVNQQSCERLKAYVNKLRDKLPHMGYLLVDIHVCRKVNGVRLTSWFSVSGFDPTECPSGLHSSWLQLCLVSRRHFYPVAFLLVTSHLLVLWLIFSLVIVLAKYQDGCRTENVQKNVGSRKFAFSSVQLLTFPKLYRPPDGSYG